MADTGAMSQWEAIRKLQQGELADNLGARSRPRFVTTMVTCGAAEVLDVSAGGMRVRTSGKPPAVSSAVVQTTIQSPWGSCTLDVQVVWVRKLSWKRFEVGLRFAHPEQAKGLLRICWDPIDGPIRKAA